MRALLLTLGLVASLQAQVAPALDSSTEDVSGKWYLKAVTTDQDVPGKDQESVLAMTFSVLEGGDLEAKVTSQADGQCQETSLFLEKTDDPGRYTAYGGKREVFILPLPVRDHFILYCEGELAGRQIRMARLLELQVSGKWFITAFVENKSLTGDRVFPVMFSILSDTHVWASMTHRDRGYCYDVDVVLEKTSVSGTYTASRGKTHVDVEGLPVKDHLLIYCEGPFEGGRFRGAKLLSRNPTVSPEALEAFKKFAQRKGLSPEDVFTPEQTESCEPASD